eukprot:GHVU01085627.1.p1 GENE.GHVU01085627.1~~GHVU01085627.1.p1  ORF type:complete len:118 (-),score=4.71 GHVU01085627.1:9-362(-)
MITPNAYSSIPLRTLDSMQDRRHPSIIDRQDNNPNPPRMHHAAVPVPGDAETVVVLQLPCVVNVSIVPPLHAQPVKVAVLPLPLVLHGSILESEYAEAVWESVPHFAAVITTFVILS